MARRKQTLILDFDGVLHSYIAWTGIIPTDPPVRGAKEAVGTLRETYVVKVLSTRCTDPNGVQAIKDWLYTHDIEVDGVITTKEKAVLASEISRLPDHSRSPQAMPHPLNLDVGQGDSLLSLHHPSGRQGLRCARCTFP